MEIVFIIVVLLFSTIIHEIAHGSVALSLGDQTAKLSGRLTLNPLKHLDIFGSVLLPIMTLLITFGRGPIFGWAKPVPINPLNFKDQKWGILKVSLAGPLTNFLIAVIFSLAVRFISFSPILLNLFSIIAVYNFAWALFNLLPFPPLDGGHILFSFLNQKFLAFKFFLSQYGFFILLFFIFFAIQWLFQAAFLLFALISGQPLML